jgi:uncharacterized protein YacL
MNSGLVAGRVIVPDLGLYEDANTALLERARTTLAKLREQKDLKIQSVGIKLEGEALANVARKYKARVVTVTRRTTDDGRRTTDDGQGVQVSTLDGIYEALRPVYLPGAEMLIKVVKKGKEPGEGIGYLEGGIKVVVDDGGDLIGKDVEVVILGALDTAVGRVVFARPKYTEVR